MKRKGKIQDNFKIIAIGGDGGTYDIGFQSLSGAMISHISAMTTRLI